MSLGIWKHFIRSLVAKSTKTKMGADHLGNTYFEIVKDTGKVHRIIENQYSKTHSQEYRYADGDIPNEWESWLRKKRDDPPTQEEIDKRIKFTETVKKRAVIRKIEDDARQEQAYQDGLIMRERSEGDVAAKEALARKPNIRITEKDRATSQSHASSGPVAYEPESWSPGQSEERDEEKVDAWVPGQDKTS